MANTKKDNKQRRKIQDTSYKHGQNETNTQKGT